MEGKGGNERRKRRERDEMKGAQFILGRIRRAT